MLKVLVAGSGGFVGTALVGALIRAGHEVTELTTGAARERETVRRIKLAGWHPEAVVEAVAKPRYDWIFNLAAYGLDPQQNDPEAARIANAVLPLVFVEMARRAGARALVHVGSCFEYAELKERRPLRESDSLETTKLYGRTKADGSRAVIEAARTSQVNSIVARLFGVYGPGERAWRLLPSLHSRLRSGQTVPLTAGTQVRDFLYVDDAASGLIAMATAIDREETSSRLVHMCSGEETSVRRFAETVAGALGAPPAQLDFGAIAMRSHEVAYLVGDPTLLHRMTKWRPACSLERGIAQACAELTEKLEEQR